MAGYTKLFSTIITSSIWSEDDKTRIMWVTMLASADAMGHVSGSIPGMAAVARMTIPDAERAIKILCDPDPYSRTGDEEGRRLLPDDGGWRIVNYQKYRDAGRSTERREYLRIKQQEHRERLQKHQQCQPLSTTVNPSQPIAEAEAEAIKSKNCQAKPDQAHREKLIALKSDFDKARVAYPGTKRGLDTEFHDFCRWHKDWRQVLLDLYPAIKLIEAERAAKVRRKEFVPEWPHFKTWLYQRRWEQAENVKV